MPRSPALPAPLIGLLFGDDDHHDILVIGVSAAIGVIVRGRPKGLPRLPVAWRSP
ncbi:MAG: hypothetical protein AAGB97_09560 [Dehalococcoidia bacterium]|nr:hypothetical protein [Chloroflexota bacterium]MBT9160576.1 hypothetical protein [Chloroflexota bacterium]MBT9162640.1 hypothetical protein [Chloroflexota bacterium]